MRSDGRKSDEKRLCRIRPGFTKNPEGSVLIEMGDTMVLCTASVEERVPPHVLSGGWVTAEYSMLPGSGGERVKRDISRLKLSSRSAEIQRLIGRSLRASIDLEALGPRQIIIDCDVLQADGGTRTASVTGGFVALALACRSLLKKGAIQRLPKMTYTAGISAGIVRGQPMLDLCYEEDSAAEVDFNLIMTGGGDIVEIQATGETRAFSPAEQQTLLELGAKGIGELTELQKQIVGECS